MSTVTRWGCEMRKGLKHIVRLLLNQSYCIREIVALGIEHRKDVHEKAQLRSEVSGALNAIINYKARIAELERKLSQRKRDERGRFTR